MRLERQFDMGLNAPITHWSPRHGTATYLSGSTLTANFAASGFVVDDTTCYIPAIGYRSAGIGGIDATGVTGLDDVTHSGYYLGTITSTYEVTVNYESGTSTITFTPAGLGPEPVLSRDGTYAYSAVTSKNYVVEITASGVPDVFRWSDDGGGTWTAGVNIGATNTLSNGVVIAFGATTGHDVGDVWSWTETPDTFDWIETGGGSGTGVLMTTAAQTLSNGVTITFAASIGHTSGDVWEFICADRRWQYLFNGNNCHITASSDVITVHGVNNPFASGDEYKVFINYDNALTITGVTVDIQDNQLAGGGDSVWGTPEKDFYVRLLATPNRVLLSTDRLFDQIVNQEMFAGGKLQVWDDSAQDMKEILVDGVESSDITFTYASISAATIAFNDNSLTNDYDTITDSGSGFLTAGFFPGQSIRVFSAAVGANDGVYVIRTVTAGTITITGSGVLTTEAFGTTYYIAANTLSTIIDVSGCTNGATFTFDPTNDWANFYLTGPDKHYHPNRLDDMEVVDLVLLDGGAGYTGGALRFLGITTNDPPTGTFTDAAGVIDSVTLTYGGTGLTASPVVDGDAGGGGTAFILPVMQHRKSDFSQVGGAIAHGDQNVATYKPIKTGAVAHDTSGVGLPAAVADGDIVNDIADQYGRRMIGGAYAHDVVATVPDHPVNIGGVASAAAPTVTGAGDAVRAYFDLDGRQHVSVRGEVAQDAAVSSTIPVPVAGVMAAATGALSGVSTAGDVINIVTDKYGRTIIGGSYAHDVDALTGVTPDNPVNIGGIASASKPTPVSGGDAVRAYFDTYGRQHVYDEGGGGVGGGGYMTYVLDSVNTFGHGSTTRAATTQITIAGIGFTLNPRDIIKVDRFDSTSTYQETLTPMSHVMTYAAPTLTITGMSSSAGDLFVLYCQGPERTTDLVGNSQRVSETNPINTYVLPESLVDTTNIAAVATYYPSSNGMSMYGYKDFSITGKYVDAHAVTTTFSVQATNDEDTASADWVNIQGQINGLASVTAAIPTVTGTVAGVTGVAVVPGTICDLLSTAIAQTVKFAWDFDNCNYRYIRVCVTPGDATNTIILKCRRSN